VRRLLLVLTDLPIAMTDLYHDLPWVYEVVKSMDTAIHPGFLTAVHIEHVLSI